MDNICNIFRLQMKRATARNPFLTRNFQSLDFQHQRQKQVYNIRAFHGLFQNLFIRLGKGEALIVRYGPRDRNLPFGNHEFIWFRLSGSHNANCMPFLAQSFCESARCHRRSILFRIVYIDNKNNDH